MRILMLNWRCPTNPKSGGAEYVTRKHLEAWAIAGHEVYWLAGSYPGAPPYEKLAVSETTINQCRTVIPDFDPGSTHSVVHIHRYATPITIYFLAPLLYWFKWRGKFDVVVDQIHGIPFLAPLWAWKSRKIAFIHEVAQEIWDEMWPFPINVIGKLYERVYFWFYRNVPFWTDSRSTKQDIVKFGIADSNIVVIPCAIDLEPLDAVPTKEKRLTFLFVGRLVKMKGVEDAIRILAEVRKTVVDARLWIVGSGKEKYVDRLKKLVTQLNLSNAVVFRGYISEQDKVKAYQRAHFLLHTSIREGFGLTVLEANSQGTPVLAYDVQGLRDLIKPHINGLLIFDETINSKREKLHFPQGPKYNEMCKSSLKIFQAYQWRIFIKLSIKLLRSP